MIEKNIKLALCGYGCASEFKYTVLRQLLNFTWQNWDNKEVHNLDCVTMSVWLRKKKLKYIIEIILEEMFCHDTLCLLKVQYFKRL